MASFKRVLVCGLVGAAMLVPATAYAAGGDGVRPSDEVKQQSAPRGSGPQPTAEKPGGGKRPDASPNSANSLADAAAKVPVASASPVAPADPKSTVDMSVRTSADGTRVQVSALFDGLPEILSPAAGSTVSGNVLVEASDDDDTCTYCSLLLIGFGPTGYEQLIEAPNTGSPTASVPTYGFAGTNKLSAQFCDDYGDYYGCGSARVISVVVDNAAPVLTAPANGQVVTSASFTASATSPGGGVVFTVDGAIVGFDGASPFAVAVDSGGLAPGGHTIRAYQCDAARTACDWARSSNPASFTLVRLAPTVRAAPEIFSPNRDQRQDATRIYYTFDRTQSGVLRIINSSGSTVLGPLNVGTRAKGSYSWVWNGRTRTGAIAPNGRYAISMTTTGSYNGIPAAGLARTSVRVDTTPPRFSGVAASLATVYPVKDSYRDSTYLKGYLSEYSRATYVQVFNGAGKRVRTISLGARNAGGIGAAWNGRNDAGQILPGGSYRFRFLARDSAGTDGASGYASVSISLKRAVLEAFSVAVTADRAYDYMLDGTYWGSSYYAGAQVLWGGDQAEYSWPLPSSLFGSYRSVRVSSCLLRTNRYPETYFAWADYDANIVSSLTSLGNSNGYCYQAGQSAPSNAFYGRTLTWTVGNIDEDYLSFWEVGGFRITGSRYVLK